MSKKILAFLAGIAGLSFVIVVHEFGHFIACKFFDVGTPVFSVGFGPRLFAIKLGQTLFQVALIPLGGYVMTSQADMAAQSYGVKMIIVLAGIVMNIVLAYAILAYFKMRNINYTRMIQYATQNTPRGFMGPIGIISLISYSSTLGLQYYLLVIAFLSLSIAFFNMLPLPILDGGQMAYYTIEKIVGPIPDLLTDYASFIFIILFVLTLFLISFKDIKKLRVR